MKKSEGLKKLTTEQLREAGRKGGKASVVARKRQREKRKAMAETLDILLDMPVQKGKITDCDAVRSFAELRGKNLTVDQAMMVVLMQKGLKGDLKAIEMIRDTVGEKPIDRMEVKDVTPVIISGEDDLSE